MTRRTVGVIGGMGPQATVDFLARIVAATPAQVEEDHIHVLVDNNPHVPSRLAALLDGTGESPLPTLIAMAKGLEAQGAALLTMPCNTAHYYLPQIAQAVSIPFLDMVTLALARLSALSPKPRRVAVLATPAVRKIGLYAARLAVAGFDPVFPYTPEEEKLLRVIRAVKANDTGDAVRADYAAVAKSLDADAYLIACTELSVLGPPAGLTHPVVDALDALVNETVQQAHS